MIKNMIHKSRVLCAPLQNCSLNTSADNVEIFLITVVKGLKAISAFIAYMFQKKQRFDMICLSFTSINGLATGNRQS